MQETTYNSAVFYDAPGAADFPSSLKTRSAELGGNWDRHFGAAEFNLVALQRLERDVNDNASITPAARTKTFRSGERHAAKASCAPRSDIYGPPT